MIILCTVLVAKILGIMLHKLAIICDNLYRAKVFSVHFQLKPKFIWDQFKCFNTVCCVQYSMRKLGRIKTTINCFYWRNHLSRSLVIILPFLWVYQLFIYALQKRQFAKIVKTPFAFDSHEFIPLHWYFQNCNKEWYFIKKLPPVDGITSIYWQLTTTDIDQT